MKATGPTRKSTRELIVKLEKLGKKNKSAIWLKVSEILSKPRRNRAAINLWRLNKLAKKFPSKTFVMPGKVLGKGDVSEKIVIAALDFSAEARKKIEAAKGKALLIGDVAAAKHEKNTLQLIK
jgi:large subunit ribosomal protein L18e